MIDSIDLNVEPRYIEDVIRLKVKDYDNLKQSFLSRHYLKTDHYKITNGLGVLISGDSYRFKLLNYVLFIPLFIYLETLLKNKLIFKRSQNILSMKEATNFHNFNKIL